MRTFIAIDLDPNLKDRIALLVQKLERANRNVKWITRDSMHLTLKFLGEITEDQASEVRERLKSTTGRHHAFELSLKGTGTFPPGSRNPRVLWTGVEPSPELAALHQEIEENLAGAGFPREERAFHPHLTLGRVRAGHQTQTLLCELDSWKEFKFGSMTAAKLTFFQSTLTPDGARYSILSEYHLT